MKDDEPIPREQREPHSRSPGYVLARNNPLQEYRESEERKETQHIQFRMVEPRGGGPGTLESSNFRTGCGDGGQYSILAETGREPADATPQTRCTCGFADFRS